MEKLKHEIAGEITLSQAPGSTMKKWREIFAITQADLAGLLKISPSPFRTMRAIGESRPAQE